MLKYFVDSEFACKCCGVSHMNEGFVLKLDKAREIARVPFKINSGFRCLKHNAKVGSISENHTSGHAVDVACHSGPKRMRVLLGLIQAGFKRIGIERDFIHVDDMDKAESCRLY